MLERLPYEAPDLLEFGSLATLTLDTGGNDCYSAPGKCFDADHDACHGRSFIASLDQNDPDCNKNT